MADRKVTRIEPLEKLPGIWVGFIFRPAPVLLPPRPPMLFDFVGTV